MDCKSSKIIASRLEAIAIWGEAIASKWIANKTSYALSSQPATHPFSHPSAVMKGRVPASVTFDSNNVTLEVFLCSEKEASDSVRWRY